ncbi:MAG: glycosyltransferase [Nitrospira sp.]|nr:glycosyltransferase [Nitrospira sp.]
MTLQMLYQKTRTRIRAYVNHSTLKRPISLQPEGRSKGEVLLSYFQQPFLVANGQGILNTHSRYWESYQIADTFLRLGYAVDVIDWDNGVFTPAKPYRVFVDPRHNMQRLAPMLPKDCTKVFYIDVAHTIFNSWAEMQRLLSLQQRRGMTLQCRRFETPNLGIEVADCATMLGNEFTRKTFEYANKPIYAVPMTPCKEFPWVAEKDFDVCGRNFLWFGSYGLVHKGLDLVLEAFAQMPDCHLTVCGPIQNEHDFVEAYRKELYQTSNIKTIGWIDVMGSEFLELVKSCAGFIYASASEGQAGAVVTCMHAGLIPIISYECGVDVPEGAGIILKESSVENIRQAVELLAARPANELAAQARANWEYARAHYTREQYAKTYRGIAKEILGIA